MVFKRRRQQTWSERMRGWLYPRTGWRRALEYIGHRLKRLPDTPHKIALGFSCGVFASFTPLFGLHFVYAGLCAMIVRGNLLAAFIGTLVGNPLTFPLIATVALTTGRKILGIDRDSESYAGLQESFVSAVSGLWQSLKASIGFGEPAWSKLAVFWDQVFLPYYVGGILPGLVVSVGFYLLGRPIVAAYQARRRSKLLARARRIKSARTARRFAEGP